MTFNQCMFIGNAGTAPKLLTKENGKSFAKFRLAVHQFPHEENQEPLWLTVLIWREELAKVVAGYITLGAPVLVSGRLSQHRYTDGEGQERVSLELAADKVELIGRGKQPEEPQVTPTETQPAVAA